MWLYPRARVTCPVSQEEFRGQQDHLKPGHSSLAGLLCLYNCSSQVWDILRTWLSPSHVISSKATVCKRFKKNNENSGKTDCHISSVLVRVILLTFAASLKFMTHSICVTPLWQISWNAYMWSCTVIVGISLWVLWARMLNSDQVISNVVENNMKQNTQ